MARILILDDEPDIRALITLMLSGTGPEVVAIVSTQLAAAELERFDVVITDMMMPEVDGAAVIQRLRQRNPQLPIIATSGAPWKDQYGPLDVATRLGVQAVIAKPFSRRELIDQVSRCLKMSGGAEAGLAAGRLA